MFSIFSAFFKFAKKISCFSFPALAIIFAAGCALRDGGTILTTRGPQNPLSRVAILTFQEVPYDIVSSRMISTPRDPSVQLPDKTDSNAANIIREIVLLQVQGQAAYQLVDEKELNRLYRQLAPDGLSGEARTEFFKSIGKELNVEGLIIGHVYRYRERKGHSYAVEYPASVAFEIELIKADDGAMVWRGAFDKTQRSLLENMLDISSFQRWRGRWATARELATEGIEDLMRKIPVAR